MSKKWLRVLLLVLISIVGGLVIVFLFSTKEASYQCEGEMEGKAAKDTLYFKLTEYRWWVVWADNDGLLNIEVPSRAIIELFTIKRVGDQVQLFTFGNNLRGYFSILSNHIVVFLDPAFEGNCKKIE
jgi:hypothetical protein